MTNREKLLNTNIYDLLIKMNDKLCERYSCIMEVLDADYNCNYMCSECIQKWLNQKES